MSRPSWWPGKNRLEREIADLAAVTDPRGQHDAEVFRALGCEVTSTHGRMGYAIKGDGHIYRYSSDDRWSSMPRITSDLKDAVRFHNAILPDDLLTMTMRTGFSGAITRLAPADDPGLCLADGKARAGFGASPACDSGRLLPRQIVLATLDAMRKRS